MDDFKDSDDSPKCKEAEKCLYNLIIATLAALKFNQSEDSLMQTSKSTMNQASPTASTKTERNKSPSMEKSERHKSPMKSPH